jgi:hypothetical protein
MTIPDPLPGVFPDIQEGGFLIRDHRNCTRQEYGTIRVLLEEVLYKYFPPEIHCRTLTGRSEAMAANRGNAATARLQAHTPHRLTVEEMLGEYRPLMFGVFEGGELVGSWQWYAMNKLRVPGQPDPSRVPLQAMPYPALHWISNIPQEMIEIATSFVEAFLKHPGTTHEGVTYSIEEVRVDTWDGDVGDAYETNRVWQEITDQRDADPNDNMKVDKQNKPLDRQTRLVRWEP